MATTETPTLSDQDFAELVALTKGADSVELKLTVPVSDRSRGAALGVDPSTLRFGRSTSSTRRSRGQQEWRRRPCPPRPGEGDDTVVKLRPVVPKEL